MIENVTYSDGAVWAAEGDAGTIVRIDPTTDEQRVYRLGHHLAAVAAVHTEWSQSAFSRARRT